MLKGIYEPNNISDDDMLRGRIYLTNERLRASKKEKRSKILQEDFKLLRKDRKSISRAFAEHFNLCRRCGDEKFRFQLCCDCFYEVSE